MRPSVTGMPTTYVIMARHAWMDKRRIPVTLILEKTETVGVGLAYACQCLLIPGVTLYHLLDDRCVVWTLIRCETGYWILCLRSAPCTEQCSRKSNGHFPLSMMFQLTPPHE